MKVLILLSVLWANASFAGTISKEKCYELSEQEGVWSRSPSLLCITKGTVGKADSQIRLLKGFPPQELARYRVTLTMQAKCMDCNADQYRFEDSGDTLRARSFDLIFDGKISGDRESGTLVIDQQNFYYRNY